MTTFTTQNHDIDDVCRLLERFIAEGIHTTRQVRVENVAKVLANPKVLTVVAYRNGDAVGILMAVEWEHPLFTGRPVSDMLVYVLPEHRGSTLAVRMIKMMERWAEELGAEGIMLGQSTRVGDMRRVMKFYEKLGYEPTGFNCFKEL